ncbi:MAG TPA: DUF1501 domain-containing protein [Opitutaceae bacterium]|nr:DUF1501 domain-containing protein [Opitutaceae bacterium]
MFCDHVNFNLSRREFFSRFAMGVGGVSLMNLLQRSVQAQPGAASAFRGALGGPHFAPKAKRIIYLFMAGGPSQHDMFDYKPILNRLNGEDLPESVRGKQRLTGMSAHQSRLPLAGSHFQFAQHGQSRAWVSELMPYTAKMVDDLCIIRSMHTEHINHDPAITFFQTGNQLPGRPSMGAWLSYGLGSANENLPAFVVLISKDRIDQPLYSRLWGNGFLPSLHQGVQFRGGGDPVLFLKNPEGVTSGGRRKMLDRLAELNAQQYENLGDAEITSRVAQYEMAYRMQTSVPDVMDLSGEPASTYDLYGEEAKQPGTFAANCLLARRLAEKDVRFIQLYHPGWDHHGSLPKLIRRQCADVDRGCYALIKDLKQRGLLEDTLVVWGGEFGRTNYSQGKLTSTDYGRDHHPRCFTVWLAGAGVRPGIVYGSTDDFGYNITENAVSVHDLQATMLHLLGIDHEKLIYRHQGRYFRLTDVEGHLLKGILT